jgi:hypothetical protein
VVAAPGLCHFDANSVVGQKYDCDGDERKISKAAAKIINGAWQGPRRDGKQVWYGLTHESPPVVPFSPIGGLLQTTCDEANQNCQGVRMPIAHDWIRYFIKRDPEYDLDTMTVDDFFSIVHQSQQQYSSIISTDDPDLSEFRAAGGKMITWCVWRMEQ